MRSDSANANRRIQAGAALVTALVFLTVVSIFGVTSLRGGIIGVRLAQNEEARFASMGMAQAMTEAIAATGSTTPVVGGVGYTLCTAGEPGCNVYGLDLPAGLVADEVAAGKLDVRVERMGPLQKPPPRVVDSSIDKFSAASFRVKADYDRSQEGLGRAQLVEGLVVLTPNN